MSALHFVIVEGVGEFTYPSRLPSDKGVAYFCPHCGEIFARSFDAIHAMHWTVVIGYCREHGQGGVLTGEELRHAPRAFLEYELSCSGPPLWQTRWTPLRDWREVWRRMFEKEAETHSPQYDKSDPILAIARAVCPSHRRDK